MIDVKIYCDDCKQEFILSQDTLKEVIIATSRRENIAITYFDCPHCGVRYTVQVDNNETQSLLETYKQTARRIQVARAKHRNEKVIEELIAKLEKQKKRLQSRRDCLYKVYKGSVYQIGDDKFKLEIREPGTLKTGEGANNNG